MNFSNSVWPIVECSSGPATTMTEVLGAGATTHLLRPQPSKTTLRSQVLTHCWAHGNTPRSPGCVPRGHQKCPSPQEHAQTQGFRLKATLSPDSMNTSSPLTSPVRQEEAGSDMAATSISKSRTMRPRALYFSVVLGSPFPSPRP